ncbi:hypothetical protein BJ742DRAFT_548971 [Cladochytrium replicatum]|nr:hypothetical protein BJ742DRAFT_548971 [Cladochytrium replicatum]
MMLDLSGHFHSKETSRPTSRKTATLLALLPVELRLHILSFSTNNFTLLAASQIDRTNYRRTFECWHIKTSSTPQSRLESRFRKGLSLSLTYYLFTTKFSTLHAFIPDPSLWINLAAQYSLKPVLHSLLAFSTSPHSLIFPVPFTKWNLSEPRAHALRTDDLPLFAALHAIDTIETIKEWSKLKCYPFGKADGLEYQCYVPVCPIDAAALLGSVRVLVFMRDVNRSMREMIYSWSCLATYFAKARGDFEVIALVESIVNQCGECAQNDGKPCYTAFILG